MAENKKAMGPNFSHPWLPHTHMGIVLWVTPIKIKVVKIKRDSHFLILREIN
jgi:hypothetical protein